ncbi:hypothetical protein Droror1_Dr00009859 [Drosera rotundifolia]
MRSVSTSSTSLILLFIAKLGISWRGGSKEPVRISSSWPSNNFPACVVTLVVKRQGFYPNEYYAKVGGVNKLEMNRLELKFLFSIDFKLRVTAETFKWYCLRLEKEARASHLDRRIKACGMNEGWSTKEDNSCSTKVARHNMG